MRHSPAFDGNDEFLCAIHAHLPAPERSPVS